MNNARRKQIDEAIALLEQVKGSIEAARDLVETIKSDEEEYRDNMPESLQSSERYENADNAVSKLEEVHSALDELDIDQLISDLNEAQQ